MSDWGLRLIFDIKQSDTYNTTQSVSVDIVKSIAMESYREFRMYVIYLSELGFFYRSKLQKIKNIEAYNIYSIDSLDLSYWHKAIYSKLQLLYKPSNPVVKIPVEFEFNDIDIIPQRIEFYYSNNTENIIESLKIENN